MAAINKLRSKLKILSVEIPNAPYSDFYVSHNLKRTKNTVKWKKI